MSNASLKGWKDEEEDEGEVKKEGAATSEEPSWSSFSMSTTQDDGAPAAAPASTADSNWANFGNNQHY